MGQKSESERESIVVNPSLKNFVKIQAEYLEHFFLQAKNFQVKQLFATSERCQEGKECISLTKISLR